MAHLIFGLILVALGVWGMVAWWGLFGLVMRGVVPFLLLVVGLVAVIAGVRRNSQEAVKADGAELFAQEPPAAAEQAQAAPAKAN